MHIAAGIAGAKALGIGKGGIGGAMNDLGLRNQFQAGSADIYNPTTPDQLKAAGKTSEASLEQQKQFLQALQGQNGIGNQSQVYNQLQGVVAGTGPNPAQAALAQATGANVANQAALMAGQRGAGANAGLMARQAAQAGGNIQQQAAGQAATLQAQQSLNALGQAGNLAGQQVGQQANATNAYGNAAQNQQQMLLNANAQYNNAALGNQANINNVNSGVAQQNTNTSKDIIGGLVGGAGSLLGLAHGGSVENPAPKSGPRSNVGRHLSGGGMASESDDSAEKASSQAAWDTPKVAAPAAAAAAPEKKQGGADVAKLAMMLASGGQVPALLSPGEVYLPPEKAEKVAKGKADPMKEGKKIPGKAKVKGDSLQNDTYPAKLEEGGIVIPRSVVNSDRPMANAIRFVHQVMMKSKRK